MGYSTRQKSFIDEFSEDYLIAKGITRSDLSENSSYGLSLRESYNKALASHIAANPQIFETDQVAVANVVQSTPIREIETLSLGSAASVFFTEAGSQANRINPFSALNLDKTFLIAGVSIVVIAAVVAYVATPRIPTK